MALSDITVRNAKPKDKPYKITDERGLYLLITSTSKYWRLDYRFLNKRKTLALGVYPDVSLAGARLKRDEARKLLAQDPAIDPGEVRKSIKASNSIKAANSFEALAREWVSSHMIEKSESHTSRILRRFELYLFPWIGSKPIMEITAPDILSCVKRVQSK